jgi:hypothetical protein
MYSAYVEEEVLVGDALRSWGRGVGAGRERKWRTGSVFSKGQRLAAGY